MPDKISQNYQITRQNLISIRNLRKAIEQPSLAVQVIKGQIIDRLPSSDYNSQYLDITGDIFVDAPDDLEDTEMGKWQFNFLKDQGLGEEDYLLDIGCAYLRGGIHFIGYLNEGHYYGMDISQDALDEASRAIDKYDLDNRNPTVFRNSDLKFQDSELENQKFDYVLAQSVFTHLPPAEIEECLANLHKILQPDGSLLATYYSSPDGTVKKFARAADFGYPFEFFEEVAQEYGLTVEELESEHPLDHNLLKMSVKEENPQA